MALLSVDLSQQVVRCGSSGIEGNRLLYFALRFGKAIQAEEDFSEFFVGPNVARIDCDGLLQRWQGLVEPRLLCQEFTQINIWFGALFLAVVVLPRNRILQPSDRIGNAVQALVSESNAIRGECVARPQRETLLK